MSDKTSKPAGPRTANDGSGSSYQGLDPADPHPSVEGNPYGAKRPGGANPPAPGTDIGPNPSKHNGSAPPRPHNAGSGAE